MISIGIPKKKHFDTLPLWGMPRIAWHPILINDDTKPPTKGARLEHVKHIEEKIMFITWDRSPKYNVQQQS